MVTTADDLLLQTTYFPFELYSGTAGPIAVDAWVSGDTFSGGEHTGVPFLDVSATVDDDGRSVSVFVVNRRLNEPTEVEVRLGDVRIGQEVEVRTIGGPDPRATNTWADRDVVSTRQSRIAASSGSSLVHTLAPHSVTAFHIRT
jgi:alpha-N-arabinofuranosidase